MKASAKNHAAALRQELLRRAETYVAGQGLESHVYRSLGQVPTVLFRRYESEGQPCHGNFHRQTIAAITRHHEWTSRLKKRHTGDTRCFLDADAGGACELDSCTSSDALAMNIFCHPSITTNDRLPKLFGFEQMPVPDFGFEANLPFIVGHEPRSTEIDLRFQSPVRTVLAECKLTERDFTNRSKAHVERYAGFAEVFDAARLPQRDGQYLHYQLIRNVLAARHYGAQFSLLCDERRPDLQAAFSEIVRAISHPPLQLCCSVITWQQIAATVPADLQTFLGEKYGIS